MIELTAVDRLEIIELQSIYACALDGREPELFARAFTEDVEVSYPAGVTLRGRDAFARFVLSFHEAHDATQHLIANHWLQPQDEAVTMRSYVILSILWSGAEGGDVFQGGASYVDRVVRTDDGWRIASRVARNIWKTGNQQILEAGRRDAKAAVAG